MIFQGGYSSLVTPLLTWTCNAINHLPTRAVETLTKTMFNHSKSKRILHYIKPSKDFITLNIITEPISGNIFIVFLFFDSSCLIFFLVESEKEKLNCDKLSSNLDKQF